MKGGPQKCCIQTKMYRLYRKITIYSHFSIQSSHFCLDTTIYGHFFYVIYTFLFGYNTTKMYRLYRKMTIYDHCFIWILHGYLANRVVTLDSNNSVIKRLLCIITKIFYIHMAPPLRKHAYSNIQKISSPKTENFQVKNSDIFPISAQNIDCGYSLEPPHWGSSNEYPQSMFWAEIRKIMYTPVNPSFTI